MLGRRVILEPDPDEAQYIIKMFENRIRGLSDKESVEQINASGYHTRFQKRQDPLDPRRIIGTFGGGKLTVKRLQATVQNTIYAAINTEKWTGGTPIKELFSGLISIKMFNEANMGKVTIFEDADGIKVFKGAIPA